MNVKYKILNALIAGFALFTSACSDDPAYSSDYDINWPQVTIAQISPADSAMVSSNITITGTGMDKISSLTIDNKTMTIVDKTASSITATLPRKFNSSAITINNLYRQTVKSATLLAPKYPAIQIDTYPDQIIKDQPFAITGTNLDLATSILIGSNVVAVSSSNATTLNVPTLGLKIDAGDLIVLEVKSTFSKVVNNKSNEIEVVN
jgi:hypothetical protein